MRVNAENMNHLMALVGECLVHAQSVKSVYQSLLTLKKDIAELEKPLQLSLESQVKNTEGLQDAGIQESLLRVAGIQQTVSQDIVRFERFSRRMEHLAHRLYNEVISSRMVPFSDGLHGFSRMVRDLARETGEQVNFEIAGAAPPVDRDILERLEAPLSHLIRNAIDHGMETPSERQQAGKPAEGTIVLDVVFNMAHEVGGTVRVDAEAGRGARFYLQLPLTLSVLRTLLLSIADEPYALPLSRIDRVLSLTHADIKEIEDHPYCKLDGEHVGILDARQLFQLPPASVPSGRFSVVVISDRLNRYGLVVDHVIGEENLVVRPIDSRLGKIPNVSAGAILDDDFSMMAIHFA